MASVFSLTYLTFHFSLTRALYLSLLLFTIPLVGAFPFAPKQKSLVTLTTLSIMTVAWAVWAHPGPPSRRGIRHVLLHFALPAAITVSLGAFGVYVLTFFEALQEPGMSQAAAQLVAQSALTTFAMCSGLFLVPFVVPPTDWWVGGTTLSGDWRPTLLATALLGFYLGIIALPPLRTFFSLVALPPLDSLLIGGRRHTLERAPALASAYAGAGASSQSGDGSALLSSLREREELTRPFALTPLLLISLK